MYITKTDLQNYLGVTINSSLDGYVSTLIGAAQDYIEALCGNGIMPKRVFEAPDPDNDVTRYYDGNGLTKLLIDDLRSITSLTVLTVNAQGVSLVRDTDYFLYPLNAVADGEPFQWIELIQPETRTVVNSRMQSMSSFIFDKKQKSITIVGKFGFSATAPDAVKLACLKITGAVIKENISDADVREISSETLGEYSVSYSKIADIANRLKINETLEAFIRKPIPRKTSGFIQAC